jgi:hypothetical protein
MKVSWTAELLSFCGVGDSVVVLRRWAVWVASSRRVARGGGMNIVLAGRFGESDGVAVTERLRGVRALRERSGSTSSSVKRVGAPRCRQYSTSDLVFGGVSIRGSWIVENGNTPEYLARQVRSDLGELAHAASHLDHPVQSVQMHTTAVVLALLALIHAQHKYHNDRLVGDGSGPREPSVNETERQTEVARPRAQVVLGASGRV